ncbi:MAG TPA: sensor histidine kinase, partial [Fibrella sp.]
MAQRSSNSKKATNEIVAFLFNRRETLLNNWRSVCEADPTIKKVSVLAREEFNDLMPIVLDILEQRLLGEAAEADAALTARSHGLHRWQKS